jgi:hypothetical protein
MIYPVMGGLIGAFPLRGDFNNVVGNCGISTLTNFAGYYQNANRIGLNLNSNSTYITLNQPLISNLPKGTIACWTNIGVLPSGSNSNFFAYQQSPSQNDALFALYGGTHQLIMMVGNNTIWYGSFSGWELYKWYHVGVTWNGSNIVFYVNGKIDAVVSSSNTVGAPNAATKTIIGYPGYGPTGSISDWLVYNRALSPMEFNLLYGAPYQYRKKNYANIASTLGPQSVSLACIAKGNSSLAAARKRKITIAAVSKGISSTTVKRARTIAASATGKGIANVSVKRARNISVSATAKGIASLGIKRGRYVMVAATGKATGSITIRRARNVTITATGKGQAAVSVRRGRLVSVQAAGKGVAILTISIARRMIRRRVIIS